MTISISDGISMSMASYTDGKTVDGWVLDSARSQTFQSGLSVNTYYRDLANGTREVTFAWRGTDGMNDWLNGNAGYVGGYPPQFHEAIDFAQRQSTDIRTSNPQLAQVVFYNVGTSHGGGLSQLISYVYGWSGLTFEAPGAQRLIDSSALAADLASFGLVPKGVPQSFFNFTERGSVVSDVSAHLGKVVALDQRGDGLTMAGLALLFAGPSGLASSIAGGVIAGYDQLSQHDKQNFLNTFVLTYPEGGGITLRTLDQNPNLIPILSNYVSGKYELKCDVWYEWVMEQNIDGIPVQVHRPVDITTQFEIDAIRDGFYSDPSPQLAMPPEPTTNTFTQNITDPSVIGSTSAPDLTTAPNQNGTAASGETWSISTDANVLNYNTDLFSAIVGDTLTGGIRPGNGIVSPTSAQLTTINGNAALVVERTPENSDPLSQYYMSLDGYQINLSNSSTYVKFLPADPLVLDLNGDGVRLTSYQDNVVLFDIDHDGGSKEQTGWVAADTTSVAGGVNNDGIVAYDLNNNGKIDDISETLSEYFNGTAGTKPYANGFAALKSLDSNADNAFTSLDAAWNNVKVWIDADHDGKSFNDANGNGVLDAGETTELKTLDELGITKINLTGTSQSGLVRDGNADEVAESESVWKVAA